jgi:hypothetical protein
MEDNKTNFITLNGKANFAINLNFEILKKILPGVFLICGLLHPIITNSVSYNYYQTGKVAIEKPTSQSINNANAPNIKQKPPTIARKRKNCRSKCRK